MARFKIGENIGFFRRNEVMRKGVVVAGPWNVDSVDHYHVKWDWLHYEDKGFISPDKLDLICDLSSEKYQYNLI